MSRRIACVISLAALGAANCGRSPTHAPAQSPPAVDDIARAAAVAPTPQALMVVGNTTLTGGDLAMKNRLTTNLGFQVTAVGSSSTTLASAASGKSLVIVSESSSANAASVGTQLKLLTQSVMVLLPGSFGNMGMTGTTSGTNFGTKTAQTQIAISNASHPMAAGLSGTQSVATSAQTFGWGQPASAAEKVATIVGSSTQIAIFGYQTGVTMTSGAAAGRRVGWFASQAAMNVFNANGWALFDAAVKWAVTPQVLLVTNSATLTTGETAIKNRLTGSTLNLAVRTITGKSLTAAMVPPAQLVLVSDSITTSTNPTAATVATTLVAVATPILSLQPATYPNLLLTGGTSGTDFGTTATQTKVDVIKAGHPLAGSLTGNALTVTTTSQTFGWGATFGTGVVKVVSISGNASRATVFGYPSGSARKNGTAAPARRVGFFGGNASFAGTVPAANAWTLFDAATKWAINPAVDTMCESKADGTACSDGNVCTQTDTCINQVCAGSNPVTCTASDQCHNAGTCDPVAGCSNPAKANGTACNDGNVCTLTDTCQSGTCTGGNPVICTASDQCHVAGTCAPSTGVCSNPAAANGTSCTDGNECTQTDTCQAGACVGSNPKTCMASDQCHVAGTCDPTSGACSNPSKADGTACNDGNACTRTDACQSGVCTGGNPVVCTASDVCHAVGTCDPTSGTCSNPAQPDGTSCTDGNYCNGAETCQIGNCTAGTPPPPPVVMASDPCHVPMCDATAGWQLVPVAAGTACSSGTACVTGESCDPFGVCGSGTLNPDCSTGTPVPVVTSLEYRSDDVVTRRVTYAGQFTIADQRYDLTPAGRIVGKTVTPSTQRSSYYVYDGLEHLLCANGSASDPCPASPADAPPGSQTTVGYSASEARDVISYVNPSRPNRTVDSYQYGKVYNQGWFTTGMITTITSTGGPCPDGGTSCTGTITFGYAADGVRTTETDTRYPTGGPPQRQFKYGADRQLTDVIVQAPVSANGANCGTVTYQSIRRTFQRDSSGQVADSARYDGTSATPSASDAFYRLPNGDVSYRVSYADLQGHPTDYTTYKHIYLEGERVAQVKVKYSGGAQVSRQYLFEQNDKLGVTTSAIATDTLGGQGTVNWRGDADAWGWPHDVVADADHDHVTSFPGQIRFDDTRVDVMVNNGGTCVVTPLRPGIADNWFRAYDPYTGAYLQPDPLYGPASILGTPAEAASYGYVAGNPVGYVDPDGQAVGAMPADPSGDLIARAAARAAAGVGGAGAVSASTMVAGALAAFGLGFGVTCWIYPDCREWAQEMSRKWHRPKAVPCPSAGTPLLRGGESDAAAEGRERHKEWDYGPGFDKEFELPSGARPDAVNFGTREVIELKPNNPEAVSRGEKQIERYVDELNKEYPGTPWKGHVETYDPR